MKYLFTFVALIAAFTSFGQPGEEVGPLMRNPALQMKAENAVAAKANPGTFDSTFIYTSDTLALPFFDDFSTNKFQQYNASYTDLGVTSETKFQLLDLADLQMSNDSMYVEIETFRRVYDEQSLLTTDFPFTSSFVKVGDLSSYPVVYTTTEVYPPFYIYDTINGTDLGSDTVWLSPTVVQDSATQFFALINDLDSYWLDDEAFHNYSMGKNPWSLGVVTFDGLDRTGYPYAIGSTTTSYADHLTSKPIDMSAVSPSDSMYFSFMYQPQGWCDEPEISDSLVLEFYAHDLDQWDYVWSVSGSAVDTFKLAHIPVTSTEYFKDGFQFRFKNYGGLSGSLDHFHIDFVNLRSIPGIGGAADTFLRDVAFSYPVYTLLEDYTSVPWDHYVNVANHADVMSDQVQVAMANSFPGPINSSDGTLEVFYGGVSEGTQITLISDVLCDDPSDNYQGLDVPYSVHDVKSFYDFDHTKPGLYQSFEIRSQATGGAANFTGNDSTSTFQKFENYYAYDDGSAELAYGPTGAQSRLAIEYTSYEADTIIGAYIQFVPSVYDVSNDLFILTIWDDNNGNPGNVIYEDDPFLPRTPSYGYGQNSFVSYYLPSDAIAEVSGTFYIGWRQLDAERLNVGLDMNIPNGDRTHFSLDGGATWNTSSFEGSVMIRPIFSTGMNAILGIDTPEAIEPQVSIYPNPTNSTVTIDMDGEFTGVEVRNMQGQLLEYSTSKTVDLSEFPAGIYFLKIDGINKIHKIIRQ